MVFEKGRAKTGGRVKGMVPKAKSTKIRVIDYFKKHPVEMLLELLPTLTPLQQSNVLVEILKYTEPAMKPVEITPEQYADMFLSASADSSDDLLDVNEEELLKLVNNSK